jgi:photosystem II stability/assembly factor-like uncharacterized protein
VLPSVPRRVPDITGGALALVASASLLAGSAGAQDAVDFTHLPALQSPVITDSLMLAVARAGGRLVAVGERGFIALSDDAGITWTQASAELSVNLTSVEFLDERRGWAGGHEGVLLGTRDGGKSWSVVFDGVQAARQAMALAEEDIEAARAALALSPEDEESRFRLEDAEWALQDLQTALEEGPSNPVLDVWFGDDGVGIAAGAYGYLFRSVDEGESWTIATRNIENVDKYHYYGLDEANDGTLFLVGEAGLLYRSEDRGQSWTTLNAPYEGSFFGLVTGTADDGPFVLVFGLRGNVFRSVDKGETWAAVDAGTEASITAGTMLPGGRIVLVGNSGAVLVSDDHGRSFRLDYRDDRLSLSGVAAVDGSHVIVVGAGGVDRLPLP